jgi:hypothetical protein
MDAIEIIDKMMEECPNFVDRLILLKEEFMKLNDALVRIVDERVQCEKRLLESEQKAVELMKEMVHG